MKDEVCLEVWGDFACFAPPYGKVERLTYPVPTPSAVRGILSSIFAKPVEFYWQVTRIEVLNPIRYMSFQRNEVKAMRPLWREDKQNQRASKQEEEGKMKPVSLDQLYEDTEYEAVDPETDVEATLMKRLLIAELHKALDELEEIDRTIMEMYSQDCTETQIGQAVGMSQRGVGKRKQRILLKLRTRLKDFR